jgi:hypothetical protein
MTAPSVMFQLTAAIGHRKNALSRWRNITMATAFTARF